MKRYIAIILNFGLYGAGYLLLGKKKAMGATLIAADVASIIFFATITNPNGSYKVNISWLMVDYVLIGLALAIDTYAITADKTSK